MNYSTGVLDAPEYLYAAAQGRIVLPYIHKQWESTPVVDTVECLKCQKLAAASLWPAGVCARRGQGRGCMVCLLTDDVDAVLIRFDQHCVEYHSFPPINSLPQHREWAPLERAMEGERLSGVARRGGDANLGRGRWARATCWPGVLVLAFICGLLERQIPLR
jgi:hypothetical protein